MIKYSNKYKVLKDVSGIVVKVLEGESLTNLTRKLTNTKVAW